VEDFLQALTWERWRKASVSRNPELPTAWVVLVAEVLRDPTWAALQDPTWAALLVKDLGSREAALEAWAAKHPWADREVDSQASVFLEADKEAA
jgi:hypothetical protein